MAKKKDIKWERRQPTAEDFVRMMEAWAANEIDLVPGPWDKIFKFAHVVFENKETGQPACPHPEWNKEFWDMYDKLKDYWGEK